MRLTDAIASHLTWTIPPAVLMTAFYWPFFTQYDYYKIGFLVTVSPRAFISTAVEILTNVLASKGCYDICDTMGLVLDPQ